MEKLLHKLPSLFEIEVLKKILKGKAIQEILYLIWKPWEAQRVWDIVRAIGWTLQGFRASSHALQERLFFFFFSVLYSTFTKKGEEWVTQGQTGI